MSAVIASIIKALPHGLVDNTAACQCDRAQARELADIHVRDIAASCTVQANLRRATIRRMSPSVA